jgi:hypothetical protein
MRFSKPVHVATGPAGNVALAVQDVPRAAELLHVEWPLDKRGEAWRDACRAVIEAYDAGYEPPELVETARKAFAAAADQADILMPDQGPPPHIPGFKSRSWRKRKR